MYSFPEHIRQTLGLEPRKETQVYVSHRKWEYIILHVEILKFSLIHSMFYTLCIELLHLNSGLVIVLECSFLVLILDIDTPIRWWQLVVTTYLLF